MAGKKGYKLLRTFVFIASLLLTAPALIADAEQGKMFYMKYMKEQMDLSGGAFTALHTCREWQKLFENDGAGFIAEFSARYPEMKPFFESRRFQRKMRHLEDFAVEYASDSGKAPGCGQDSAPAPELTLPADQSTASPLF